MRSESKAPIRRVMSCNGRTWETDARGASEYLFNPVFMLFFMLCVVLYTALMQLGKETELPILGQMILWAGLIMTSLIWLFIGVWTSVVAYDRGLIKMIYMPLVLLPLVFINGFMTDFALSVFNSSFHGSNASTLESLAQNAIIIITFDIMHERFVVPQHPKYVGARLMSEHTVYFAEQEMEHSASYKPNAAPAISETSLTETQRAERLDVPQKKENASSADVAAAGSPTSIVVAREKIDASLITWIKSEDHYLSFQMKDQNLMLRGKLQTVVKQLGDQLGMQINRSVWVAYGEIRMVEDRAGGYLEIHLEDGTVFRVSGSRRLNFKQNYERFKAALETRLVS